MQGENGKKEIPFFSVVLAVFLFILLSFCKDAIKKVKMPFFRPFFLVYVGGSTSSMQNPNPVLPRFPFII